MSLTIALLDKRLERGGFSCGVEPLDRYFREQARKDMKRLVANCFAALDGAVVAGFYTLSSASIPVRDLPEDLAKRLPRYPVLPAIRIGRLAVASRFQGQGIGSVLLVDAMKRAIRAGAAGFTLLVDAKDARAASFYRQFGFMELESRPGVLFLPLATAGRALGMERG